MTHTVTTEQSALEDAQECAMQACNAQGYEAGMQGKAGAASNPYEPNSEAASAWKAGWQQAMSVQREMRKAGF